MEYEYQHEVIGITYLIKHPLEASCSRALILRSTTVPVQTVNFIQSLYNWRYTFPPIPNREYLPIRTNIFMTI